MPQWLGWVSLLLAVATLSPFGFLASLVFVLWAAVAGIAIVRRGTYAELGLSAEIVNAG